MKQQLKLGLHHKWLLGLSVVLISTNAALAGDFKPYVGLDFTGISANYKSTDGVEYSDVLADSYLALSPYIGLDMHENFAIELGYMRSNEKSKNFDSSVIGATPGTDIRSDLKLSGFYVDGVGKYPVSDKTSLLASVGISRLKANVALTTTDTIKGDDTETVFRLGGGIEHAIADNINLRGMVRYINADFDGTVDGLVQYGVGLNYQF